MGSPLHVFFFPYLAQGHMIPMIDIARLFSLRGIKSTIITTPLNALNISPKISRYQNSGLDINIQIVSFPCEEVGLPKGCENVDSILFSPDMRMNFMTAVGMLEPEIDRLLEQVHPDCIVSDMFLPWTTDVARNHGIPRLVFHGCSFFALCIEDSLKRYPPPQDSDTESFLIADLPNQITMKKSQMPHNLGSNERIMKFLDQASETEVTSFGVLVNSFYELEPAYAEHYRKVMGRRAWHIGPVSLSNNSIVDKVDRGKKAGIDEDYCLNWLDSKDLNSVIYVSFGSVARFSCAQLIEIAEGLYASGVSFIWVVRVIQKEKDEKFLPDGFEERIQGRGLVIRDWAPQVLILDHPAVGGFVTHCGWNSILEGVSAGLPMITWPLFAEQFSNEILICELLKIGMKVGVEKWNLWVEPGLVSVNKERVEKVVSELMNGEEGEEMRKRAKGLQESAKKALEEGGSSYADLTSLIEELQQPTVMQK